jgi:hypothetical protein
MPAPAPSKPSLSPIHDAVAPQLVHPLDHAAQHTGCVRLLRLPNLPPMVIVIEMIYENKSRFLKGAVRNLNIIRAVDE